MEAYQSLSNRVASMEDLLRRSESTMVMVLQRLKVLEEHASASEARNRGEQAARYEELSSRMNTAMENQNSQIVFLKDAIMRQSSSLQVLEERLQGTSKALEQKTNNDISGCYQRMQTSENSFTAALRNLESLLHSQSSAMNSLEQNLRVDIHSMQQHTNGEIMGIRQRVEMVESALNSSLKELHKSVSSDIRALSENFVAKIQNSVQSMDAALLGVDQKVRADMRSLHESLGNDISLVRQNVSAVEVSMRDALRALHGTLANDITKMSSLQQEFETAHRAEYQRLLAELAAKREQMETIDANWRSSVMDLGDKLQDGWRNILSQVASVDLKLQQKVSHVGTSVEELSAQIRRTAESLAHSLEVKMKSLENLSEDVTNGKRFMTALQEEQQRLREELKGFSAMVERSGGQLRSFLEAAVQASHSDLLERIKPLLSYRSEMHAAVAAALNKLWSEANRVFTSQGEMDALQNQIQVLDDAVRNEVSLLIEKGRVLERRVEDQRRLDVVTENRVSINPESGVLMPLPVLDELNNVWVELRNLQKQMGMPREEVLSVISDTRKQLFDAALNVAKSNEKEFRDILSQVKKDVCEILSHSNRPNGVGNSNEAGKIAHKPKRTVVRVLSKNPLNPPQSNELPPVVRVGKGPNSYSLVEIQPKGTANDLQEAPSRPRTKAVEAATHLPSVIHSSPEPTGFVSIATSLSTIPSPTYQ
ncbi:putative 60S ribosomal protein L7a [Trypanosoma cruzi]|nr:putative 60S ribosomal protein L7a [Trypanosoma cruzi]